VKAFKRVTVDAYFNRITQNRVLVTWALERTFAEPGPYSFALFRGYSPTDDNWRLVADTVDQPWLYDKAPVWPGKGLNVFYRVQLVDGNGRVYVSPATGGGVYWGRYDWSLAKEIIRKETLVQQKRAGVKGWLLQRRYWGDPCACADPDTGQVHDPKCPECFGTTIVGGYYAPFEYWVIMDPTRRLAKLDPEQGLMVQNMETVRSLAYPRPQPGDVWVHSATNQRYAVQGDPAAVARHRGIDLILNLRIEELDRSHPVYEVPTPC
jgi:hypothetical protein